MNDKKNVVIAIVLTFCLATVLFALRAYGAYPYDPWWDLTDDGKIDIADLARESAAFGTLGDPTKVANIANWPNATDIAVWWDTPIPSGGTASNHYQTKGFAYLHVLVYVSDYLAADTVSLVVFGELWNAAHIAFNPIEAYRATLTASQHELAFTILVPSQNFYFAAYSSNAPHLMRLSYYLTWG